MNIKGIRHKCRRIITYINKQWMCLIPKDKRLILFSAWFGNKYADNAMYMYEFFQRTDYKPVWYTRNKDIYNHLKSEDKLVVYGNTLKAIWTQIRAKMLVSSVQFADFSELFLSNCIFLDLGHGFPNKQIGYKQPDTDTVYNKYIDLLRTKLSFYMTAASEITRDIQMDTFNLRKEQVIYCNKPRTDVLFDKSLRDGKNENIIKLIAGRKAIVYMPTHRSCGAVPIGVSRLMDLDRIQYICEKYDAVFLIRKHYYHRAEHEELSKYSRIIDITSEILDTQVLLYQADIIVSDYSSCYIDYLLLNRPVILYTYDLEDYLKKERGLYLGIQDNHVGFKPKTSAEFCNSLESVCKEWTDMEHLEGRKALREHYFSNSVSVGGAREEVMRYMVQLLNGTYKTQWDEQGRE